MDVDAQAVARAAFEWLGSVAVDADGGSAWLEGTEPVDDLYSGTAGVLLGCAEAAAAGLDTSTVAAGAVARLLHLVAEPGGARLPHDGLFSGWAGVAVALRAWAAVAGDAQAHDGAVLVTGHIVQRVRATAGEPMRCTDVISGDAGVLLALLAGDSDSADDSDAASVLAERLVRVAEPVAEGIQWRMTAEWPYLMPGFSHGTAGVAYALAAAGRQLGRPDLIEVAVRGAETLLALGQAPQGWALDIAIPPRPRGPRVNFGWCHGPTGTVRLFWLLDAIDPAPRWRAAVEACLQAIADSGLPARRYPGFWDNVARCCGTAGVGRMLLDRYQATGDTALLDRADRLAADVIDRAVIGPDGARWSNTEHTATPPDLAPEPGFMQGAAGIAGWLARLGALHTDRGSRVAPLGVVPPWV